MRIRQVVFAAVVMLLGLLPARAEGLFYEFKIGALAHDVNTRIGSHVESDSLDINFEAILSPSMPLLWGTLRPALGATINTVGQTSHAYVGARWQVETAHGIFLGLGLGVAVHDGNLDDKDPNRKALGSRALFHIPAELGIRLDEHNSVSLYFEHISNAGLAGDVGKYGWQDHNGAMDRLGIRYGYRF